MSSVSMTYAEARQLLSSASDAQLRSNKEMLQLFTDEASVQESEEDLLLASQLWERIAALETEPDQTDELGTSLYCAANAMASLARMATNDDPQRALVLWKKEREFYSRLWTLPLAWPRHAQSAARCNYGNCLSHLGRVVEALHQYNLALAHDFENKVAQVAYGECCLELAPHFPQHAQLLLDEAFIVFQAAILAPLSPEAYVYADYTALSNTAFGRMSQILKIEAQRGNDTDAILERIARREEIHVGYKAPPRVEDLARRSLLLSVAPNPTLCPSTSRDDLFPIRLGKRNLSEAQRMLDLFSHMKEDFSFARFQLLQYQRKSRVNVLYSALTDYATIPSSTEFGLRPALLKSVVRAAIDGLDRVSKFLELALEIPDDNPKRSTSFNTVWYEKKDPKNPIKAEIAAHIKPRSPVAGLFDIHSSWDLTNGPFKHLRDLFVHDLSEVTGYAEMLSVKNPKPDGADFLNLEEIAEETVRMLRGAICYCCQVANQFDGVEAEESMPYDVGRSFSDELDLTAN